MAGTQRKFSRLDRAIARPSSPDLIPPEACSSLRIALGRSPKSWRAAGAFRQRNWCAKSSLADLRPDIVHVSTLFEGFHNGVVASVGRLSKMPPDRGDAL